MTVHGLEAPTLIKTWSESGNIVLNRVTSDGAPVEDVVRESGVFPIENL